MFDVGIGELFLCFVIALIVLGPEKLPKVARMVGRWSGQARGYMKNLSAELERETHASEIRQRLEEANRFARAELASFETKAYVETQQVRAALTPPPADSSSESNPKP